ncbi:MAG: hypothetical protein GEU68_15730 [Actinobacteria bacterium]|nr:hypothetical protein [Actinomycetota bacterium]
MPRRSRGTSTRTPAFRPTRRRETTPRRPRPGAPAPATGYRPITPTRDYQYLWDNVWFETECSPSNFVVGEGNDIDAAITNLFVMHNRMHDWSYNLGFTEAAWNGQQSNFRPAAARQRPRDRPRPVRSGRARFAR